MMLNDVPTPHGFVELCVRHATVDCATVRRGRVGGRSRYATKAHQILGVGLCIVVGHEDARVVWLIDGRVVAHGAN